MSEFDLNPEEPNFEDINASLAGNFSQKDEENKLSEKKFQANSWSKNSKNFVEYMTRYI